MNKYLQTETKQVVWYKVGWVVLTAIYHKESIYVTHILLRITFISLTISKMPYIA